MRDAPVTPQLLHHVLHLLAALCWSHLAVALGGKLGGVHLSKLLQGERPTVKARTEADRSDDRINLDETDK